MGEWERAERARSHCTEQGGRCQRMLPTSTTTILSTNVLKENEGFDKNFREIAGPHLKGQPYRRLGLDVFVRFLSLKPREFRSMSIFSSVGSRRGCGLSCKYSSGTRTSRVISSELEFADPRDRRGTDHLRCAFSYELSGPWWVDGGTGEGGLGVYGTYSSREKTGDSGLKM